MLGLGFGEDQNIIKIHKHKPIDEVPQNVIYQGLENRWGISKTKWHYQILKVSQVSIECCFPFIALANTDRVVGIPQIQLTKDCGPLKELKGRGEERQRVLVLNCYVIQSAMVYTWLKRLVFLFYKEKPCCYRRGGGADDASS